MPIFFFSARLTSIFAQMVKRKVAELKKSDKRAEKEDELPTLSLPDVGSDSDSDNDELDSEEEEDKKLEALLGEEADEEEDDDDDESEESEEEVIDPSILKDLERPVHIKSLSDSESDDGIRYEIGADGKPREIRPEIIPDYDSDDSDLEESNTIGNVPLSAYDEFPHIGYDIDGKRIMRPATGSALDSLLETIDIPEGWTGLLDKNTGKGLNISAEELDLIKRLQRGEQTNDATNPYEDTVEWFTGEKETMPLSSAPEPKRRFIPSKHEAKKVMKIVRAIREGRIVPNKPKASEDDARSYYDIWADNAEQQPDHIMHLRAPKLAPPTHEESYNPPEEYLPDDKEKEEWDNMDPEDRERNFLPQKFDALRKVPGYSEALRERFERSLDLYLAPRVRRNRLNVDPDSLIPELPSPKDLRPFPIKNCTIYTGHKGKVRSVSVDPTGQFLATGGDDGTVRVWEVLTGRELWKSHIIKNDVYDGGDDDSEDDEELEETKRSKRIDEDHVECVQWNPQADSGVLAVSAGSSIYFVVPPVFDVEIENKGLEMIEAGWAYATDGRTATNDKLADDDEDDEDDEPTVKKPSAAKWTKPSPKLGSSGVQAVIRCKRTVKSINWHRKGDYIVSVSPQAANSAVIVHQLSKHSSQSPFRKSKGIIQTAKFHPFRPHLYVATQRYVRIYDLAQQVLAKKLMPGVRWLSSFDIHPRGDNVITGSYDKRVTWHDMDLSNKPYKTLRYHEKGVRDVGFHKRLPLFCSASDDGHINVFHGSVYDDMMKNPLLVPLKVLKGHTVTDSLGILDIVWHPVEAWLFSAGADGTARLWVA